MYNLRGYNSFLFANIGSSIKPCCSIDILYRLGNTDCFSAIVVNVIVHSNVLFYINPHVISLYIVNLSRDSN